MGMTTDQNACEPSECNYRTTVMAVMKALGMQPQGPVHGERDRAAFVQRIKIMGIRARDAAAYEAEAADLRATVCQIAEALDCELQGSVSELGNRQELLDVIERKRRRISDAEISLSAEIHRSKKREKSHLQLLSMAVGRMLEDDGDDPVADGIRTLRDEAPEVLGRANAFRERIRSAAELVDVDLDPDDSDAVLTLARHVPASENAEQREPINACATVGLGETVRQIAGALDLELEEPVSALGNREAILDVIKRVNQRRRAEAAELREALEAVAFSAWVELLEGEELGVEELKAAVTEKLAAERETLTQLRDELVETQGKLQSITVPVETSGYWLGDEEPSTTVNWNRLVMEHAKIRAKLRELVLAWAGGFDETTERLMREAVVEVVKGVGSDDECGA